MQVLEEISTGRDRDFIKLEDFTSSPDYNYLLGVFVNLNKLGAEYTYFQKGEKTQETDLRND